MGCKIHVTQLAIFGVGFVVPFALCAFLVHPTPTAQDWKALLHFILVECMQNLFIGKFHMALPPLIASFLGPQIMWIVMAVGGLANFYRFTHYYFAPPVAQKFVADLLGEYAKNFPVCTQPGGCSILADAYSTNGSHIWVDDALCIYLTAFMFFYIEGRRYGISWVPYVLFGLVLGVDTMMPIFLLTLRSREDNRRTTGQLQSNQGLYYVILAEVALLAWAPQLFVWARTRGTVDGQYDDGVANPTGFRAVYTVMGMFMTYGGYVFWDCAPIVAGIKGFFLAMITRFLIISCFFGNVAGGMAGVLYFREFQPGFSFRPSVNKLKPE